MEVIKSVNDGKNTTIFELNETKIEMRNSINYSTGILIDNLRNKYIKELVYKKEFVTPEKDKEGKPILRLKEKLNKDEKVEREMPTFESVDEFNRKMKTHDLEIIKKLCIEGDIDNLYEDHNLYNLAYEINTFAIKVINNRGK